MRSLRCEVCGVKALIAASTCPKCHHEFDVRDGAGELLPLAYCSSCDSYYPERLGSCRWCGTPPERAPIFPYVWKGAGVAAFVVVAFVAWRSRDAGSEDIVAQRTTALTPDSVRLAVDTIAPGTTIASAGTIDQDSVMAPDISSIPPSDSTVPAAVPPAVASAQSSAKPPAAAPAQPSAAQAGSRAATSSSRTSRRWVNSVSRSWMTVRARPSEGSRIVASIGPNSRVQLGESRGAWRRIRAKGLSGWVPR